jgi:S1-C subfamily serine protease
MFMAASGKGLAALPMAVEGERLPSLAPVLERVTPSVVNIYTQTRVRIRSPLLDESRTCRVSASPRAWVPG